jgi:hypothetical protein
LVAFAPFFMILLVEKAVFYAPTLGFAPFSEKYLVICADFFDNARTFFPYISTTSDKFLQNSIFFCIFRPKIQSKYQELYRILTLYFYQEPRYDRIVPQINQNNLWGQKEKIYANI